MYFKNCSDKIKLKKNMNIWTVRSETFEEYIYTNRIKANFNVNIITRMTGTDEQTYYFGLVNNDNFEDKIYADNLGNLRCRGNYIHKFTGPAANFHYNGTDFMINGQILDLGDNYTNWSFFFQPLSKTAVYQIHIN